MAVQTLAGKPVAERAVARERGTEMLIWALLAVRLYNGFGMLPWFSWYPWRVFCNVSFMIATMVIISILIYRERKNLAEYHLGALAVIIFIAGQPLLLGLNYLQSGRIQGMAPLLAPVCLVLLVALLRARDFHLANPPRLGRWLLVGVGVGLLWGVISGLLVNRQPEWAGISKVFTPLDFLVIPFTQLASAACHEEPLFRGFLWGLLEKKGWPGWGIWLFQAAMFWLGHIYYLTVAAYSIWLTFVIALFLGWLAWRSRDIAPGMLAHGLTNGIASIVAGSV